MSQGFVATTKLSHPDLIHVFTSFCFFYIFIGVQLLYNGVLVSAL